MALEAAAIIFALFMAVTIGAAFVFGNPFSNGAPAL